MRLAISQLHSAEIQLSKLGFKRGATTVLLIPCKTNTNWWHDFVMPFAEIRFLRGRVAFVYPNGEQSKQALPWPLAFVIYRPNVD
jgi:site-specific DNA-methyltransferase (adenine-specific)